jgi:DNA invertase Pin-like site-specific DNA recombinase
MKAYPHHTPAGKAMYQILGVFAEFERAIMIERVKSGLARARSQGKRLGRRPWAMMSSSTFGKGSPPKRGISSSEGTRCRHLRPCSG